jgi:hypothetical protein
MYKYNQSLQAVIDNQRKLVGKGNWKITPYSAEYAVLEHFINGKWIAQGSYSMKLIKQGKLN